MRGMDSLTRDGIKSEREARLLRVFRCAKRLCGRTQRLTGRAYELDPADLLALRSSLASAALVVMKERISE